MTGRQRKTRLRHTGRTSDTTVWLSLRDQASRRLPGKLFLCGLKRANSEQCGLCTAVIQTIKTNSQKSIVNCISLTTLHLRIDPQASGLCVWCRSVRGEWCTESTEVAFPPGVQLSVISHRSAVSVSSRDTHHNLQYTHRKLTHLDKDLLHFSEILVIVRVFWHY